jgi:hypothetical protein
MVQQTATHKLGIVAAASQFILPIAELPKKANSN